MIPALDAILLEFAPLHEAALECRLTAEQAARMSELRRTAYRGHGVEVLEREMAASARPAEQIRKDLAGVERRLARIRSRGRAASRAQATTRNANLGRLAQSRDALLDELARTVGEPS